MSTPITSMFGTNSHSISATATTGNQALGKDEFLKLLVAQLRYQDPLSPLEGQEFASQLAQFTSVEELTNIGETLEISSQMDLLLTNAVNNTMSANFIGKQVFTLGNNIKLDGQDTTRLYFALDRYADKVDISVLDAAGNEVRTLQARALPEGRNYLEWDGEDSAGKELPEGNYTFKVKAEAGDGIPVESYTLITGLVSSIRYLNGVATLIVNGGEIPLSEVLEISIPVEDEK